MGDKIYFIAGKGGSGKDTVLDKVSEALSIPVLPVHITRKPRSDDRHCVYETIDSILSRNSDSTEVRSYLHVDGWQTYATFKEDAKDGSSYLATGPSEMYLNFPKLFPEREIVPIVLDVSAENRLKRMNGREEEEARRRVKADDEEWQDVFRNSRVVDGNGSVEDVIQAVMRIIKMES